MTGPTREEVEEWARESLRGNMSRDNGRLKFSDESLSNFAALAFAAGARSREDSRDAARYRWLRSVPTAARARSIVNDTPWGMDRAIDAAMGGNDAT